MRGSKKRAKRAKKARKLIDPLRLIPIKPIYVPHKKTRPDKARERVIK